MRGTILVSVLLMGLFTCICGEAQYYRYKNYYEPDLMFEIGVGVGALHALTDLGGRKGAGRKFIKDLNAGHARPNASVHLLALFRHIVGLRLEVMTGSLYASDQDAGEGTFGRFERNLSFRSGIQELQGGLELYPFTAIRDRYADPPVFDSYFLGGAGYFRFSPQAKLDGRWVALHSLRTEGQGFPEFPERKVYSLNQFNLAVGGGLKWKISEGFVLRFEICHRVLWTDYLDDVSTVYIDPALFIKYHSPGDAEFARRLYSRKAERDATAVTLPGDQRGNPANRDSYFSVMIKAGLVPARKRKS